MNMPAGMPSASGTIRSEERSSLPPLKWFPINKDFRFKARYTAYA